jgi:4-diphosphocytidyl-2-C-methyl-D-erythritol kinase
VPAAHVRAFAKVNLALRVLAREASGYHQLETLFCRIDLADDVVVRVREGGERSLDSEGADLGPVEQNLAWRAAAAYAERDGWPRGFAIEIEKRIPVGGGLGGGSADAGAVLRALNSLNARPLPDAELLALAFSIGADVPFLTTAAPLALAWGRGERMLALPALPERDMALVLPPFGVPTGDAYAWLDDARTIRPSVHGPAAHPLAAVTTWGGVVRQSVNDFEVPVFDRRPELGEIHGRLAAVPGVTLARMSGSGSTLFALFDGDMELRLVAQATGCKVLAAQTLGEVPLVGVDLD